MFKLRRISTTPILAPIAEHNPEREAVLDCGVVYHGGLFHMVYRASDCRSVLLPRQLQGLLCVSFFAYSFSETFGLQTMRKPRLKTRSRVG